MQVRGQHQLASDSLHTKMSSILTQQFYFGEPLVDDAVIQELGNVTCESLQTEAKRLLESNEIGIAIVGPEHGEYLKNQLHETLDKRPVCL